MSDSKKTVLKKEDIFEKDDSTPMGYRIKRPEATTIYHKSKLLQNNANFISIIGATGSGKSTALLDLLVCFTDDTKYIMISSAKFDDDAHSAVKKYCEFKKIKFIFTHDAEETSEAIADMLDEKKKPIHAIIIFDDFNVNYSASSSEEFNKIMIKSFSTIRSQNVSAIAVTQSYNNLNSKLRLNCNMRIAFKMDDEYSVRALISDVAGAFFNPAKSRKETRHEIACVYGQVYQKEHAFIVVLTTPPPAQIRLGWLNIVYPPNLVGEIAGGAVVTPEGKPQPKKRVLTKRIAEKQALYKQALELGFPKWKYKTVTPEELEKFIKFASAKGQKNVGNTAPEIEAILNGNDETPEKMRQRLFYNTRQFKANQNPKHLEKISHYANQLVEGGHISLPEMKYIIRRNHLDDFIEM